MNNIIVISFVLIYYSITLFLLRNAKFSTHNLCICGIFTAMTLVLESIQIPLPTGTTIPLCSPVPLILLAVLIDYQLAIFSGIICGFIAMLMIPGWQPVHWSQFFIEHIICFSCFGYAGIWGINKKYKLAIGVILSFCLKSIGHILSGVIFFSQNTWDGWNIWTYSIAYNFSQNIPLCILSGIVILSLPLKTLKIALQDR